MKIEKETFFYSCQAEANKPGFDINKMVSYYKTTGIRFKNNKYKTALSE